MRGAMPQGIACGRVRFRFFDAQRERSTMSNEHQSPRVSPELDEMVCDLIGYMLDELAEGRDPGVVACAEDAAAGRVEAAFSDDGEEACLAAAHDFISQHAKGSRQDGLGPIDRYAIAYAGCISQEGVYQDALLVSFYERALPTGYSAFVAYAGAGTGDGFLWSDPQPAGEEPPLI